ncbi:MAG: thioredoxin domain-containing protein [Pseudomonadota bacterium]|nr:thioredoxin domain-containing protein [Pseudomonadota bacterium]|tara:strand:+ start:19843 stop:21840 length:1998 start_codon:yes stop_codon:yes gene_type:complete
MNKLVNEKSLYLLQHADNPVNWYPWTQEAFEIAKNNNKPIILSIGYSACHWCHVMAQESFEDSETAEIMNKYFVNIKVDKEERPDLDKVYQMSQTIITGKTGGWPLTIFMSPDKFPFFAGTYFPNEQKYGLPSFKDVLKRVNEFYSSQQKDIKSQNMTISEIFQNLNKRNDYDEQINLELLDKTRLDLLNSIDKVHGGFGSAPKFPQSYSLLFLLNSNINNEESFQYVLHTLNRMCLSGIFDHLEGGFFRYSVDELWMIPHFEKMLYDNGPLISVLCKASKLTSNKLFLKRAVQTSDWIINKMQDKNGGIYSTIDADSEHVEGKYYVWDEKELKSSLDNDEFEFIKNSYFVDSRSNFEGKFHFHITKDAEDFFLKNEKRIAVITKKLLTIRNKRIPPNTDKKILVSWNALAIIGLLDTYKLTDDDRFLLAAKKCFDFIKQKLWDGTKLYACFNEKPCFQAYLDDYAYLLKANLELLKIEWSSENLYFSNKLANILIKNFQNHETGGFYFTSIDHEELIYRPQTYMDESMPAGNSIAIEALSELGFLVGNQEYIDASEKTLISASNSVQRSNTAHASLLNASMNLLEFKKFVIIRCSHERIKEYRKEILNFEEIIFYFIDNEESDIPKSLIEKKPLGNFTAYICEGFKCLSPIRDFDDLCKELTKI